MDGHVGYLLNRLEEAGVLDNLNVIIVSDHGMAEMKANNTLIVKDYVDVNLIDEKKTVWGIAANVYPRNESVVSARLWLTPQPRRLGQAV